MNKHLLWISFFSCILLSACQLTPKEKAALLEPGVGRSLAEFRKKHYQSVEYNLLFTLPSDRDKAVTGLMEMSFSLTRKVPVVIDFRADASQIRSVALNNQEVPYVFENEHIWIDAKHLPHKGPQKVSILFVSDDQSLNRRDDYLYTLSVPDRARTLYPCFDQPNLKAKYRLILDMPQDWKAVSNSRCVAMMDGHIYSFLQSEPLSTYLFSFVAGQFEEETYEREGRKISIYHRETDPQKVTQCPDIASEVFDALEWMEDYTAIPYPFMKYDLVILPGFQFGGMEHTGATLYNDQRMFLNAQPTLNERLSRSSLIAHETAHMWFGDYVTMEWFDDVWTKEVFANYFAARMVEPLYPEVNHRLNFMRAYYPAAYSEDRTAGTTPIQQSLDNLSDAGLVYGQIIYNKSPIVMEMLVEKIGEDAFRKGIQEYLSTYAYGNATWDGLIDILGRHTPEDLNLWSRVWVKEKGMPEVSLSVKDGVLKAAQTDPLGRGLYWPQRFNVRLVGENFLEDREVNLESHTAQVNIQTTEKRLVIPGTDGRGYGFFRLSPEEAAYCFTLLRESGDEVMKGSLLLTLYENLLHQTIDPAWYSDELLRYLSGEENSLLYAMALGNLVNGQYYFNLPSQKAEQVLWEMVSSRANPAHRLQAFRSYRSVAKSADAIECLYAIWKEQAKPGGCQLSENDYISLSYLLAIYLPERAAEIIPTQQARIQNPDRLKEYQFIAPSVSPLKSVRDSVFVSLLKAENRRIEPWTSAALSHLNHPLRQADAIGYIRPALELLPEIQRTGDIFFPTGWLRALLAGHLSADARQEIDRFLIDNPRFHPLLTNKLKQQSDHLYRFY